MDWLTSDKAGARGWAEMAPLDAAIQLGMVAAIVAISLTLFFSFFSSRSLAHYLVCRIGEVTLRTFFALSRMIKR